SGTMIFFFFFFQAEDGIRDYKVTGVQTCALPICAHLALKGRPTVGDKGLKTPSSADNRLIDTTQTAREESEIFIRKPEVRDPRRVVGDVTLPPPSGGCQGCQLCLRMAQTCCQPRRLVVGM